MYRAFQRGLASTAANLSKKADSATAIATSGVSAKAAAPEASNATSATCTFRKTTEIKAKELKSAEHPLADKISTNLPFGNGC